MRIKGGITTLTVVINGTDVNPWLEFGLTQNPFPQIAKAELMPAMAQLNKLGAEPIKSTAQIREILKNWSEEFISLCCEKYRSGKTVDFTVSFPVALADVKVSE